MDQKKTETRTLFRLNFCCLQGKFGFLQVKLQENSFIAIEMIVESS